MAKPTSKTSTTSSNPKSTPKSAPKSSATSKSPPAKPYDVVIRSKEGTLLTLRVTDTSMYQQAFYWRYVATNPQRLTTQRAQDLFDKSTAEMGEYAKRGGQSDEDFLKALQRVARSGVIEVSIPYEEEGVGWGARTYPWENVLSVATKKYRNSHSLTIVRHLNRSESDQAPISAPQTLLTVSSAPFQFSELFALDRECELVRGALSLAAPSGAPDVLRNPTRDSFRETIESASADVIHLAGVDNQSLVSYADELGIELTDSARRDGMVFRGTDVRYDPVTASGLAKILTANEVPPTLVSFSACYSAARIAPMSIIRGVRSALAFNDVTDDSTSGLFFPQFYATWQEQWDLLTAFDATIRWLGSQPLAQLGAGIVLWSDRSLVAPIYVTAAANTESPSTTEVGFGPRSSRFGGTPTGARQRTTRGGPVREDWRGASDEDALDRRVDVEVAPRTTLNYSLLHNAHVGDSIPQLRTPYFQIFSAKRRDLNNDDPLDVEARLHVGEGDCCCRFRVEWPSDAYILDLRPRVVLPLVANLQRQASESLNTTWEITVRRGDELLKHATYPVRLLPADEWRDDSSLEENRAWLASFTLPRDPAVLRVIQSAQRYLRTILDDAGAGFDGYQRIGKSLRTTKRAVDSQVQALWATLLHELPLSYINPPPTYSEASQRLRTPSVVFDGRSATCIDLALTFASCLEFVGISPVIFLTRGHAFPGYWRSDRWCAELQAFGALESGQVEADSEDSQNSRTASHQQFPWMYDQDKYRELQTYVSDGKLVPFESTLVTRGGSFKDALEEGSKNLKTQVFDAMVDIQIARQKNVTPLPI